MFKGTITNATVLADTNIPLIVAYNTNDNTAYSTANNAVAILKPGFYDVDVNLVVTDVAVGDITAQLYANDVAIAEAVAIETSGATTDFITLPIMDMLRVLPTTLTEFARLSVRLDVPATVVSGVVVVEKVR